MRAQTIPHRRTNDDSSITFDSLVMIGPAENEGG